jgi:dihydroflavonol-4-reductase
VARIVDACCRSPSPPVLLVVSSLAAAGPSAPDRPLCEIDPPRPVSLYGRSKRAGEQAAEAEAARLPITIVRPAVVFGPGDRDCLAWFKSVRGGIHLVPSLVERRLALVHVADLVTAIVLAAERGRRLVLADDPRAVDAPGYYFVASEPQPTYAEMGRLIATAMDRRVRVVRVPEWIGWLAAGASQLWGRVRRRPGIVNLDKLRDFTAGDWCCSIARARDELGFEPAAPLIARLGETADWYRAEGWL